MVLINKAINEVTVKLVYYGPGLCGKTTNLEKIYANPKLDNKGKMISMSTETDRTLFFDFMPMELGTIAGQKVRVQLYTVPGQVFYDATRKLVLRGADGVVFVADSQDVDARVESRQPREPEDEPAPQPHRSRQNGAGRLQLQQARSPERRLGRGDERSTSAPAARRSSKRRRINGGGVTATLRAAVARILDNLKNNVDTTIARSRSELAAPDMIAKSGVTSSVRRDPEAVDEV